MYVRLTLTQSAASVFLTEDFLTYIYFPLFEEITKTGFPELEKKISPTISLFFRKMTA